MNDFEQHHGHEDEHTLGLDQGHDHENGHGHDHSHDLAAISSKRLWWALVINLVFLVVEVAGGIITNSLALLADAGHMLTDVAALALALVMAYLAKKPATAERTFGLLRAEVLGAFINGATLVLIVGLIVREAWHRFGSPQEIDGPVMLLIAAMGLAANLASAWVLSGSRKDNVNVEGAFLHMMADALGSVGAIVAGAVIWVFGWYLIDPIVSVVIGVLILWSSWGLLKTTINILLEGTPEGIEYADVKNSLEELEHIDSVHDLHIWTITSGKPILSAHINLSSCCCDTNHWQECLKNAQHMLKDKFGIEHTTLQISTGEDSCDLDCKLVENGDGH